MKIYLSGRISGLPEEECKRRFSIAEKFMLEQYPDAEIVNPLTIPSQCDTWEEYIIRDLQHLKDCDMIAMLPYWEMSKGATIEHMFAKGAKKNIYYI